MSLFDDRNKTDTTKDVTAAACLWLDERGCKPVETEVPVCDGWVADIAGMLNPTMTELRELRLVKSRPEWGKPGYEEWWADLKEKQKTMTVVVEVKTSIGDFRGDRKWELDCPSNLCYLAIPKDLPIKSEDLPVGWGLLIYGDSLRCVRVPNIREITLDQQFSVVMNIAIRRDNQTRYEHLRRLQREHREYQNDGKSLTRVRAALRAALSVARGEHGSIEGALEYHGIRNPSGIYVRDLETLWGIARPVQEQP